MPAELDAALEYHIVNSLHWPGLRPLQAAAVEPVSEGLDSLLIAPTAGGKTEAAVFPTLTRMMAQDWQGLSVLYVAPLRALLNNLHPRLEEYGAWIGRRVGLWHGDINDSQRKRMLAEPPDVLLTTPESLEAMLVSTRVDPARFLGGVRTVVIDELHAFASTDRGWHLLGVLERIERLAGRKVQRVGLSATLGNPGEIAQWMQGSTAQRTSARVVTESAARGGQEPQITLDYVGSVPNAATVIASMHRGEKRLVFAESRRKAEALAYELRALGVETFLSHSSLAVEERRRSEQAFAESRDCVIVATSTLELGVDIGDLDRVIQLDAPRTVASFLQRLGRTGRRPGTTRNMMFLVTDRDLLPLAAGILVLWRRGFVEPVLPPPHPRHLTAQQLLALALQQGAFGASSWTSWWGDLPLMDDGEEVLDYLRAESYLVEDSGRLMIGPTAESEFGRRHFMELLSSFNVEKELRVIAGTKEIGFVSPLSVPPPTARESKPLVLNGYGWRILDVNWDRFVIDVHPEPVRGDVRWKSEPIALSFEVMRAQRDVLLGETPEVTVSVRASTQLELLRGEEAGTVSSHGLVSRSVGDGTEADGSHEVWTWAGLRANATLAAAVGVPAARMTNEMIVFEHHVPVRAMREVSVATAVPWIDPNSVEALKFSAALPWDLAVRTLAERFTDRDGAAAVAAEELVRG